MSIILGGDHLLMRPDGMALADVYGRVNVGIIKPHYLGPRTSGQEPVSGQRTN